MTSRLGVIKRNNYNCHNIYWDPLIWLVKNGHLIALTCILFFNEPGPYSWGAGPFMTELLLWYCAMLLWREMDSLQLLTLYLALTSIFSGRKAKINLHTTPKLTVVIPISCLPWSDPGIFVRGGGGSTSIGQKSSDSVVCLSFAFFIVLPLVYRSQMVNFKEKYHFSRFRWGSIFIQGGPTFSRGGGGVQLLIPYRKPNNLWFSRGGSGPPAPPPPLWIRTWLRSI